MKTSADPESVFGWSGAIVDPGQRTIYGRFGGWYRGGVLIVDPRGVARVASPRAVFGRAREAMLCSIAGDR